MEIETSLEEEWFVMVGSFGFGRLNLPERGRVWFLDYFETSMFPEERVSFIPSNRGSFHAKYTKCSYAQNKMNVVIDYVYT